MRVFLFRKVFWKYTFYITLSILAIVNILFFFCNWKSLTLTISNEAILLSVVGFFFAFAGINIYSIFNTNIETEKQALRNLKERYDGELRLSAQMLQFPQELIMIWHTAMYITTSQVVQGKSFDWLRDLKKRMKSQRDFVQELRNHYQIENHERFRDDLANLAQGALAQLKQHKDNISLHDSFFTPIASNKETYLALLDDTIAFVEETISYDYEPELPQKNISTWGKVKEICRFAKKTFNKK